MTEALTQAQDKLNELLQQAQQGMIIPIRLPGQLEEIIRLVARAQEDHAAALQQAAAAAAAAPPDLEAYIKEEAYFVGHAVHEIRNPLTSVRGYADMIPAMGELNDNQKNFMATIKTNILRMQSLLADVGLINKLRKGTLKASPKMDMFKNLALRVEKDMTPLAKELNRQLTFDIAAGLPLLNVDGDLLVTAVNKLVENALRYSPAETGQVQVSATAEGSTLVIAVQDNGIGIAPADLARLGEIYFRSDEDAVREFKGSGLGIPIVYGLVQFMGGTVDVTTEVGRGTRFTLRLPGLA
ncbi:MAG: HAMP domain-containing histidine kinase [Anaerolineae bacterium]|jgi:signal transduction histidine kinase|nr:HAMP domain-containing histidine kinase [Anaerolineae bacterium]